MFVTTTRNYISQFPGSLILCQLSIGPLGTPYLIYKLSHRNHESSSIRQQRESELKTKISGRNIISFRNLVDCNIYTQLRSYTLCVFYSVGQSLLVNNFTKYCSMLWLITSHLRTSVIFFFALTLRGFEKRKTRPAFNLLQQRHSTLCVKIAALAICSEQYFSVVNQTNGLVISTSNNCCFEMRMQKSTLRNNISVM